MSAPRIVVGASHAGSELAARLRQLDPATPVTLIGEEPVLAYQRPPLSKSWLGDPAADIEALLIRSAQAYAAAGIEAITSARVMEIDRATRRLRLASGESLGYSQLALATGARPRRLVLPGSEQADSAPNFHYVRTHADAERLRPQFREGAHVVIIGGGYIGLELAALARKRGLAVTLLEAQDRVLARVTAPQMSAFYQDVHAAAGVAIRTGAQVSSIELGPEGQACAVRWRDAQGGGSAEADLVIAGIGVLPNIELAMHAGLDCAPDGVRVDTYCRTSDPTIVAAGDCTSRPVPGQRSTQRVESVPNAMEQARSAAATLCGQQQPCTAVPWFWSDQYDLKLQMVGLSQGHDAVVIRGDMAARAFTAFYLRGGLLIAADAVNRPADFMLARKLVAAGVQVAEAPLADASFELRTLITA